mgnify:CR=1 FL=1
MPKSERANGPALEQNFEVVFKPGSQGLTFWFFCVKTKERPCGSRNINLKIMFRFEETALGIAAASFFAILQGCKKDIAYSPALAQRQKKSRSKIGLFLKHFTRFFQLLSIIHQLNFIDHFLDVAIHEILQIVNVHVDAVIGDTALRVIVRTDFRRTVAR